MARLVVLAAEVGGRWSHEAHSFVCASWPRQRRVLSPHPSLATPVVFPVRTAHSTGTSGRWRQAATTSDEEVMSPSQPKTGRRSNKDRATSWRWHKPDAVVTVLSCSSQSFSSQKKEKPHILRIFDAWHLIRKDVVLLHN